MMMNQQDDFVGYDEIILSSGSEVSSVENASPRSVCISHAKPLVRRSVVAAMPGVHNDLLQLEPLATHTKTLAFRPAVPEVIVEQSSTLLQPSTLQHQPITKQASSIRPSYSNLRRIQRQYREQKRRQLHDKLKLVRGNHQPGRVQSPKNPLEQSDTKEGNLRMELQVAKRCVGWHEKTAAELLDNVDLESESSDLKLVEVKFATELVSLTVKRIEIMEGVRKLLVEQAKLEAWQEWGRELMDRADSERRKGERKSEGMRGLGWRLDRDWHEAIDRACEAAIGRGPWVEAMMEGMGKTRKEAKERVMKERGNLIQRAKDRVVRMRDKISRDREWQVGPEVDSDDILPDFTLDVDDVEAEEMDMDMDFPVDMAKKTQEVKLDVPKV